MQDLLSINVVVCQAVPERMLVTALSA